MAGTAAARLLSPGGIEFAVAEPDDDADLRRLLRENPMPGAVAISLEREPSFFNAAHIEGDEHQTIICRDESGRMLGMGSRAVRTTLHDGRCERAGYLSQLRLDRSARRRIQCVTRGYQLLRDLHEADGRTRLYLTSIMEDNTPARRLLESGLRGLPAYRPIDRFETSIISRSTKTRAPGVHIRRGRSGDELMLASIINECHARFRFAQFWDSRALASLASWGLAIDRFFIAERNSRPVACAAVWDQRSFKQSVVRGYSPMLRSVRPLLNLLSRPMGLPHLPEPGVPLPLQFLSHAACRPGEEDAFRMLIGAACELCRAEGCSLVTGFAARHPLASVIKAFPRRELRSLLYVVTWPDGDDEAHAAVGATVHPEVSLL